MYSVYQRWDPLLTCAVGQHYPPEFYHYIKNTRVRSVMERIAEETEEDFQKLIKLLERFNVEVIRPEIKDFETYQLPDGSFKRAPAEPRDYGMMLGQDFYYIEENQRPHFVVDKWDTIKGADWPSSINIEDIEHLPTWIQDEIFRFTKVDFKDHSCKFIPSTDKTFAWNNLLEHVKKQGNNVYTQVPWYMSYFNTAMILQVGKDLYCGNETYGEDLSAYFKNINKKYPDYRLHQLNSGGHPDGTICPVKPGLLLATVDLSSDTDYQKLFPGWEIFYTGTQSTVERFTAFHKVKNKNKGKWYVPGEEKNNEFTEFVEQYLSHWVGYVEETRFEVNNLMIDDKNIICGHYDEELFKTLERHGVTPHYVHWRHQLFWDSGIHCSTLDINRKGSTLIDCFPTEFDNKSI